MKKWLSLFLCVMMLAGLAACGETEAPGTDSVAAGSAGSSGASGSVEASDGSGSTDAITSTNSTDPLGSTGPILALPDSGQTTSGGYDSAISHKILVTDVRRGSVAILDLNKCSKDDFSDLTRKECTVWEWSGGDSSLSGVKLRKSDYYGGTVLLVTFSRGSAQIVDYRSQEILWSAGNMYNAHSIEILPNGDVVVAASGNSSINYSDGGVYYYPADGERTFFSLPFAHAVIWDPDAEHLWAAGFPGVVGLTVSDGALVEIKGKGAKRPVQFSAHDMAPIAGEPGRYWVTDNAKLWIFDGNKNTLSASAKYSQKEIKGIAHFPDGTVVVSPAGKGSPSAASFTKNLYVFYDGTGNGTLRTYRTEINFPDREFYKIHAVEENYR